VQDLALTDAKCIRSAETADSDPGQDEQAQFTPALQRIDRGMTTTGKLRRTVLVSEEGKNRPPGAGFDGMGEHDL
jgi:hypothetical protein